MTNIDQFESVFKAAAKTPFQRVPVRTKSVVLVTDVDAEGTREYQSWIERFLEEMGDRRPEQFCVITGDQLGSVTALLDAIRESRADLICTYRNLRIPATEHPYSLGVYVDVMSQVAEAPLLLLPRPEILADRPDLMRNTREVMAVTDHLTGDHRLVSYAAHFTAPGGKLFLSHIEDAVTFERYMEVISKLPSIDTEVARQDVLERLLKEPRDYIESCRAVLAEADGGINVEAIVRLGRRLSDYKTIITDHGIDLVVLNTKDADQLAMHGYAYPLAVELRTVPLLML